MKIFNRLAKRDYNILETLESGVVLLGGEVKSIRLGRVKLEGSFARIINREVFLYNVYINPYQGMDLAEYDPKRTRKLLLRVSQINILIGKLSSGKALIPLSVYTTRNLIKVELALGASKKKYDHRRAIKERDEQRKIEQELRGKN